MDFKPNGSYIVFSIDDAHDLHTQAKFLRHVDTKRAMGELNGTMLPIIGSYKGQLEHSYIMREDDFYKHVVNSGYVDEQESFLHVKGEGMMSTIITRDDERIPVGHYKHVDKDTALSHVAWSYRPDINAYFVAN